MNGLRQEVPNIESCTEASVREELAVEAISSQESHETGMAERQTPYMRGGKRILDVMAACLALPLISPILLTCAIAVWADSGWPVLFRQSRIGQHGRPFQLVKFRTMVTGAEKQGARLTASGDSRVTRVGRILRKTKLDELPQLVNVLRGEMSLVGPRPEVPEYTAFYTQEESRVLSVKPGITGPASLTFMDEERVLAGRGDKEEFYIKTIMRRKLHADLKYCSHASLSEDIRLIALTVGRLLVRERQRPDAGREIEQSRTAV